MLGQHGCRKLNLQPPPPGADVNTLKTLRCVVNERTQALLLAQWADATQQLAR